MENKFVLALLCFVVCSCCALPAVQCQPQDKPQASLRSDTEESSSTQAQSAAPVAPSTQAQSPSEDSSRSDDETLYFAFLKEDPRPVAGPVQDYLKHRPILRAMFSPRNYVESKYRPMLQWSRWANKHQRFFPAQLLMLFVSALSWALFPVLMQAAAEESRNSFWKSFGYGFLVCAITIMLLRCALISEVAWPLAILIAGLAQGAALVGLSVSLYHLGHSFSSLLKLAKIAALASRPGVLRFIELSIGSSFAALILQIPPVGEMPRCGTRLLCLFAVLGIGAICRELRRRRTVLR